uniref:glutathione S-transferase family protein n=1 Tax=uncultured Sphingomonas sp. TaxID=158754 RepID=UPI0035CBE392
MHIKLFHHPVTRSARILWLLHELAPQLTFEVVPINLYRGDQYEPGFLKAFPFHSVPAVEITLGDGARINMSESGAIVVALADLCPESRLAPVLESSPIGRSDYLQTIHLCGASFEMQLWQIRIHKHVLRAADRDERTVERYMNKFNNEVTPWLSERLWKGDFVCGENFTAADCMVGYVAIWARSYGLCRTPQIDNYVQRLSSRPAFKLAFADAREFNPAVPDNALVHSHFTG